jgi:hypothetical protein
MNIPTMKLWYVIDVNPVPWAVGPLSVGRAAGKVYPKMGRNQELHSYQEAVRTTMIDRYLNPIGHKYGDDQLATVFGGAEVELGFYFFKKLEVTHVGNRTRVGKKPDLTNMVKAAEDAIAGLLFDNDVQVMAQRNVILDRSADVPEGMVIISIQAWRGWDAMEIPPDIWGRVNEMTQAAIELNDTDAEDLFRA